MKKRNGRKKQGMLRESWEYIKESRNHIYFAVILFLVGAIIGFAFPDFFSKYLDEIIRELVEKTNGLSAEELIFFIFKNNIFSALLTFVLGVFVSVVPVVNMATNGVMLGYVMFRAVSIEGFFTVWRILPHGIFELPAIFISAGLGIRLGLSWFEKKNKKEIFKERFWKGLKAFLSIVLPLLIIAAIIEGFLIALSG